MSTIDAQALPQRTHKQTGPNTQAGKNRSRWNALKDGATAKSPLLPFEDPRLFKLHMKSIREALSPNNYVETQLVDEYGLSIWKIERHEKRTSYEQEKIFSQIKPVDVAAMLGLSEIFVSRAPDYLTDLKHHFSLKEQTEAQFAYTQYKSLIQNATGIANYNLVWRQYPQLFYALAERVKKTSGTPIFSSTGKDLHLDWQQNPKKLETVLRNFAIMLYYVAKFKSFKPAIRVWMQAWYFAQRSELNCADRVTQTIIKERNHTHGILDRLLRYRKSGLFVITQEGEFRADSIDAE